MLIDVTGLVNSPPGLYDMDKSHIQPMTSTDRLLQAFTKACQDYSTSQLQMFQEDADEYAAKLINIHGIDPEQLDDIYFSFN
ncbi:gp3 [Synechococcus phage Syn5]|uniref:Gp3 n=1 Tax=Synechococcus phage Syn5 TaxID=2914003 RepID=A4ZR84_9CAUD|nr:gp3 [Synechococcus phage Syn5]ABP87910.1 gp3 [Synechococcus phage Syn5]